MTPARHLVVVVDRDERDERNVPLAQYLREARMDALCDDLRRDFASVELHGGPLETAPAADLYLWFVSYFRLREISPAPSLLSRSTRAIIVTLRGQLCRLAEQLDALGGIDDASHGDWMAEVDLGDAPVTLVAARRAIAARLGFETTTLNSSRSFVLVYVPMAFVPAVSFYAAAALAETTDQGR